MNLDLEGYFCPDCGHRVTVTRQEDPMRRTILFCVAFHRLRYAFEMNDVEGYHCDSVEEVVHLRIRKAIEEIRTKVHPIGQVQYDGILPEGVQFVKLPVYTLDHLWGTAKEGCAAGDLVHVGLKPPVCKPAYPPARKILL